MHQHFLFVCLDLDKPNLKITSSHSPSQGIEEGTWFILECMVKTSYPNVAWYDFYKTNDKVITTGINSSICNIYSAEQSQSGLYYCTVHNRFLQKLSNNSNLVVKGR